MPVLQRIDHYPVTTGGAKKTQDAGMKSLLPSGPRRALAALRARVKLFDKCAQFRIDSPRLLRRPGFHQLLAVLIHFGAAVGTSHFGFGFRHLHSWLISEGCFLGRIAM